ncbi:hypothetical protein [Pseudoduganella sp. OTU4001]|uniref:hypothetical protein n=1 Tax=Pseudoduganella sp. OTU4001 TaxID=3043854 RepID=UPI00313DB093
MKVLFLVPLAGMLLSGCAMWRNPNDPSRDRQSVVVVNSMTWPNAASGKTDGTRTVWPLPQLVNHEEIFPLAQLKNCPEALPCAWGVLSASRSVTRYNFLPGGISLDLAVNVDVHRRQQDRRRNFHTSIAVPADVPAISYQHVLQETVSLPYGKVYRIDMDHGITYRLCAQRVDETGKALDKCEIPYI